MAKIRNANNQFPKTFSKMRFDDGPGVIWKKEEEKEPCANQRNQVYFDKINSG